MKDRMKVFGRAFWREVGRPVLSMALAMVLVKHTGLDQMTAATIGQGTAAAVDSVITP